MFKVLIPAVAALAALTLAAQTRSADASVEAAPAMGWHLSHEGAIAKLAYGVENSDQLALMMTCMPGDAQAVVYGDVKPAGARLMQAAFSATGPDPLSAGDATEETVSVRDPALRRLASSGVLRVEGEAGRFDIKATPAEKRVVSSFLSYCSASRT